MYPGDYIAYPSAGVDSYQVKGKPSLRMSKKRIHVIGLGYDNTRSSGILSILDPEQFYACVAYNQYDKGMKENVCEANSQILSDASIYMTMDIGDFSFMFSKLCEIAYEYLSIGDVIFAPDGPKPLIMAMSMVVSHIQCPGVTCIQILENENCFHPVDVSHVGKVIGFSISYTKD